MSDESDYETAPEFTDSEDESLGLESYGFCVWTSENGTKWYLPLDVTAVPSVTQFCKE